MTLKAADLSGHDVPGLARNARASREAAILPVANWLELLAAVEIPICTYAVVVANPRYAGRIESWQYRARIRAAQAARQDARNAVYAWAS